MKFDKEQLTLTDGTVLVEFTDLGEGWDGDYQENDPNDTSLLRFDVSVHRNLTVAHDRCEDNGTEWLPVQDASYCTQMPVDTDVTVLEKALRHIMSEVRDPLKAGHSIKRLCEKLSWISPTDFP